MYLQHFDFHAGPDASYPLTGHVAFDEPDPTAAYQAALDLAEPDEGVVPANGPDEMPADQLAVRRPA